MVETGKKLLEDWNKLPKSKQAQINKAFKDAIARTLGQQNQRK